VLVASEGSSVVGILPLYIDTRSMLRYPVRLLRLVGTGGDTSPDDLGPVLAAGHEAEVAHALAEAALRLPGWDVLWLTDLDPTCAFTTAMAEVAKRERLASHSGRSERITFMTLPASFDAWLASLHRDRRYRIKNARKKLEAAHPDARFFVWTDPATLSAGVEELIRLHTKRWQSVGEAHGFSSPEYRGFHHAVMAACMSRDRLRLYGLELSGQLAAMYYFYKFRDRTYLMQSGFDPDYGSVKPGNVLLGYVIEHAIGEGHAAIDFLRGNHRYKEELATGERQTVYLTVYRWRPGAAVYLGRRHVLPALKARLVKALKRPNPPAEKPT
jgi:CelD/BcsL family acetyltransferase involved in cellulose biosynthesis